MGKKCPSIKKADWYWYSLYVIGKEEWAYKYIENLCWTGNRIQDPCNSKQELYHLAILANIHSPYRPNYYTYIMCKTALYITWMIKDWLTFQHCKKVLPGQFWWQWGIHGFSVVPLESAQPAFSVWYCDRRWLTYTECHAGNKDCDFSRTCLTVPHKKQHLGQIPGPQFLYDPL